MRAPRPPRVLPALTILLFAACSDGPGAPQQVTLSSIEVTPAQPSLQPDASVDLQAQGKYSDGSSKSLTDSVSWSSGTAAAVSVSDASGTKGHATWTGSGSAVISASYLGKTGTTTVTALGVNTINVGPGNPSLEAGNTQQMSAQANLSNSASVDVTTSATWSSSNTAVATVSNAAGSQGRVTAVGAGSATISASWKGATGQTTATAIGVTSVSVMGPNGSGPAMPFFIGGTMQLSAIATMSNGAQRTVTDSGTWSSSTSAITVSNTAGSRGLASRAGEDSAVVSLTYKGVAGSLFLRKACVILASGLSFDYTQGPGVGLLFVAGGNVVWYDYDPLVPATGGAFRSVATSGGTVTTIKSGLPYMGQWTLDAQYIYWMFVTTQGDQSYRIVRMDRSSGAIDSLFVSSGLGGGTRGIAVDGSSIYYSPGNAGGVRKMPKAGGAYTSYHASTSFYPRWISLDAATGTVYGVDFDGGSPLARRVPTDGTKMDTLASARASLNSQLAGGTLYWSENAPPSSRIARVSTAGGSATTVATGNTIDGFLVDGGYAYFGLQSSGGSVVSALYRQSLAGGTPEIVTDACGYAQGQNMKLSYLASDATYLYFTDLSGSNGQSRILRVKK